MLTWRNASRASSPWRASASGPRCAAWTRLFWKKPAQLPPDRAGLYQRHLRHQPGARQRGLPAHVCLAGCRCWRSSAATRKPCLSSAPTRTRCAPALPSRARRACAIGCRQPGATSLPNVVFIDSQEYISSYELIQRSKFVMVYNSSIGLEAALMGKPVLCGGQGRYTQIPDRLLPARPGRTTGSMAEGIPGGRTRSSCRQRIPAQRPPLSLLPALPRLAAAGWITCRPGAAMGFVELQPFRLAGRCCRENSHHALPACIARWHPGQASPS